MSEATEKDKAAKPITDSFHFASSIMRHATKKNVLVVYKRSAKFENGVLVKLSSPIASEEISITPE
jgi:hypothetical protein